MGVLLCGSVEVTHSINICYDKVTCMVNSGTQQHFTTTLFLTLQTLDNGFNVIQLETAAGAAIQNFKGAMGKCAQSWG